MTFHCLWSIVLTGEACVSLNIPWEIVGVRNRSIILCFDWSVLVVLILVAILYVSINQVVKVTFEMGWFIATIGYGLFCIFWLSSEYLNRDHGLYIKVQVNLVCATDTYVDCMSNKSGIKGILLHWWHGSCGSVSSIQ